MFEITHRIHYGYTREPGVVYDDLTEADMNNLGAPRPGFPHGYGRRIGPPPAAQTQAEEPAPHVAVAEPTAADEPIPEPIEEPRHEEEQTVTDAADLTVPVPDPRGTGSDAPTLGSDDTPPVDDLHCPDESCKFRVGGKQFKNMTARDAHLQQQPSHRR